MVIISEMKEESKSSNPTKGNADVRIPHDLRVMAVDSDRVVLKILIAMLKRCQYQVTGETEAKKALDMLRKSPEKYDIVITDVVRDDMDGFKILEVISLEMDIPVIMLSASDDKNNIMKAIKHGARDYISKPVRVEVLRNIWQHVFRKRLSENRTSTSGGDKEFESYNETADRTMADKEIVTGGSSGARKKARLTWSPELHRKFIAAVNTLGTKQAVPKKILEMIDESGVTRENIASHLQKYRKMLKKQELEKSENEACREQRGGDGRINIQAMKNSTSGNTTSGLGPFATGTGLRVNPLSTTYPAGHPCYAQMPSYNNLNQVQHSNWLRSATTISSNFPTLVDLTTMANLKPQALATSQMGPQTLSYNHVGSTPSLDFHHPISSSHPVVGYPTSTDKKKHPLLAHGTTVPSVENTSMYSTVLNPPQRSSLECRQKLSPNANETLEGILGSDFYKNKQISSDDDLNSILNQFTNDGVPKLH